MSPRPTLGLALFGLTLASVACGDDELFWPPGNAESGKVVFEELRCYSCHEVKGAEFPAPSAITPTYVPLGATGKQHSRNYLLTSIIAPSHQFAEPSPPPEVKAGPENVMSGERSRMSDFTDRLTIRQLIDLVAYLQYLESLPPEP